MATKYYITIKLSTGKNINLCLDRSYAPVTVDNFINLVKQNYFDGVIFHRIIAGFMIQTGGYKIDGYSIIEAGDAKEIVGEFSSNGHKNDLHHELGVISMARTSVPDSASSQFFICAADCGFLDGQYAAFGKTTDEESNNVVLEVSKVPTCRVANYFDDFPQEVISIDTIVITGEE